MMIFSDSRSVVDIASSNRIDRDYNYLVLVLRNKLRSAFLQGLDVVLAWIPAYVAFRNELTNFLIKRAVREGKPSGYLPSHTDFYSLSRERYIKTAGNILISQANRRGSQYFNFYPSFSATWFSGLPLNRTEIVMAA